MNCRQAPLAQAKGLGSARSGVRHWWHQRVTAAALVPLTLWLALSVVHLPTAGHAEIVHWLILPWNTLALLSLLLMAFYHAIIGIQVVIEDYVHAACLKRIGLMLVQMFLLLLALVSVYAVILIVNRA